jgi:hypothetical protein
MMVAGKMRTQGGRRFAKSVTMANTTGNTAPGGDMVINGKSDLQRKQLD